MHKLLIAIALVVGLSFSGPAMADEDASASSQTSSSADESSDDNSEGKPNEDSEEESGDSEPSDDSTAEPAPDDNPAEPGDDSAGATDPEPTDDSLAPADEEEPEESGKSTEEHGKSTEEHGKPGEQPAADVEDDSVTICHANGANDFSKESTAADATAGGHDDDADDIIPPFDYAGGSYGGKNYDDAGKALLASDCVPVVDPELFAADLQQQQLVNALVMVAAAARTTITICHATNAPNNPYVVQNPSPDGDVSGHADHTGPVFQLGFTNADDWGDIIPPFNINGVDFPGLNWDAAGQAIFNAGCVVAGADPNNPDPVSAGQVTICHAIGGSEFSKLSVTANGTVGGHAADSGDIIPPFSINGVDFPGLNWDDEGQELFDDDCTRDDDDDDDDDDSDDSDDSDDEEAAGLPYTGGAALWILILGGSLILGGVALVNNRQFAGAAGLSTGPGSPSVPLVPSWSQLAARPVNPGRHRAFNHVEPVWIEKAGGVKAANRDALKVTLTASIAIGVVAFLIRYVVK